MHDDGGAINVADGGGDIVKTMKATELRYGRDWLSAVRLVC